MIQAWDKEVADQVADYLASVDTPTWVVFRLAHAYAESGILPTYEDKQAWTQRAISETANKTANAQCKAAGYGQGRYQGD
jgi:hypothetical protein